MAITYRGTTLPYAKHQDGTTPRATKIIAFPAVDGTQVMHMGKRARQFQVSGRITDMLTGTFTKDTIENWNDTNTGTLAIHGTSYTNVRIKSASFGEPFTSLVDGKMVCTYTIEFEKVR